MRNVSILIKTGYMENMNIQPVRIGSSGLSDLVVSKYGIHDKIDILNHCKNATNIFYVLQHFCSKCPNVAYIILIL